MDFDYTHVPQANRPELVLRIAEMATTGPLTLSDINNILSAAGRGEFVERQALYYAKAAELFGLIKPTGSHFVATDLATKLRYSTSRPETRKLLKEAALSNPLFFRIVENFQQRKPSREEIATFLQERTALAESTSHRRASSVLVFMTEWLFGEVDGNTSLNSREWVTIRDSSNASLPEWAQFFLDLGRVAALESKPGVSKWRLVTVPNRNMAASLFATGYLEAKIPEVLSSIDEFDVTDLNHGDQITWRVSGAMVFGHFIGINKLGGEEEQTFSYSRLGAKGLETPLKRVVTKAREYQFAQYFGQPFVTPRQMSRNRPFFESFAGSRSEDLLCNSISVVCLAGRPQLRDDLVSHEFKIEQYEGSLDDLLRVRGINDANEVAHFLTEYISPSSELEKTTTAMCAVFDGHLEYPKLKHYINAEDNLVILDRWENGSITSVNAFDLERASHGQRATYLPTGVKLPNGIEYMEWSESR